jgi:hypothetical protein
MTWFTSMHLDLKESVECPFAAILARRLSSIYAKMSASAVLAREAFEKSYFNLEETISQD